MCITVCMTSMVAVAEAQNSGGFVEDYANDLAPWEPEDALREEEKELAPNGFDFDTGTFCIVRSAWGTPEGIFFTPWTNDEWIVHVTEWTSPSGSTNATNTTVKRTEYKLTVREI